MSGPYLPVWSPGCAILIGAPFNLTIDDDAPVTISGLCRAQVNGAECRTRMAPITVTAAELRATRGHFETARACPRCENILTLVLEARPVRRRR